MVAHSRKARGQKNWENVFFLSPISQPPIFVLGLT